MNKKQFEAIFYLKINRTDYFSFLCIQHWINIIEELGANFYFVCDKNELKKQVLKKITFKNSNVKFIKSAKWDLRNIIKNIATPNWNNATYAQLTPFLHSLKNKNNSFYNIDADDTMFICEPKKAAEILKTAKDYADNKEIKAFSLDMHVTQFRNKHWSFGITYTNNDFDWMNIFKNIKNKDWQNEYKKHNWQDFNLDCYFTYLRKLYSGKIETFYVENLLFIHWATLLCKHLGYAVQKTSNGLTRYPLFKYFNAVDELSDVKIPDEVIKIDVALKDENCTNWGRFNIVNEKHAMNVVNWFKSWEDNA